jgi:hypothetical protein
LEEREITLALRDYLLVRGWQILSIHFPGAQGGLSISVSGKLKRWVPDIIAYKNKIVLVGESKPRFSHKDVDKLNRMFNDPQFIEKLRSKFNFSAESIFQQIIAFHSSTFDQNQVPYGFIVFLVKGKDEAQALIGNGVIDSVVAALLG